MLGLGAGGCVGDAARGEAGLLGLRGRQPRVLGRRPRLLRSRGQPLQARIRGRRRRGEGEASIAGSGWKIFLKIRIILIDTLVICQVIFELQKRTLPHSSPLTSSI